MSPNNPNQHTPTDAEIQNRARWEIYDDDDPWNQTAADNAEWLIRFKRDVGLAPQDSGPGLPVQDETWQVKSGGSGFSPPYAFPKAPPAPFNEETVSVKMGVGGKIYNVKASTSNKYLKSMASRYEPPAAVFCSRELETSLSEFVKTEIAKGLCPDNDALRAKAREILGVEHTAADDMQLLEKFKALHGITNNPFRIGDLAATAIPDYDALQESFNQEIGDIDLSTGMDFSNSISVDNPAEGGGVNYASLYHVHTATASPLRRRASLAIASRVGSGGSTLPSSLPPQQPPTRTQAPKPL
jgi:hypothetical protein